MRNTFRIYFFIKRTALTREGRATIMTRITIDGQVIQFSTKTTIVPAMWSAGHGKAVGRTPEARQVNDILDKIRSTITTDYNRMVQLGEAITPEKLRNALWGKDEKNHTLMSVIHGLCADKRSLLGRGITLSTLRKYDLTCHRLQEYLKRKHRVSDIALREIRPAFVRDFALWLMADCGLNNNSAIKLVQILKQVMLLSVNNGWLTANPFANYRLSLQKTDRGYLRKEELERMLNKRFSIPRLDQVRDLFIFACFTGLSYIDIRGLRSEHICTHFDGHIWIITKRQKTGIDTQIRLFEIPQQILEKYRDADLGDYVLPVISHQRVNSYLKEIADLCEITKNLTFHLARHTFATTVTLSNGVPIETVSKMLGHTNIKTTLIYARITDEKVSRDMEALTGKLLCYNYKA